MANCVAQNCPSRKTKGKSFHKFPKDEDRRKEWVAALQRDNFQPAEHARICADHFEDSCFDHTGRTARLRTTAVPTIFDFPTHLQKKSSQETMNSAETADTDSVSSSPRQPAEGKEQDKLKQHHSRQLDGRKYLDLPLQQSRLEETAQNSAAQDSDLCGSFPTPVSIKIENSESDANIQHVHTSQSNPHQAVKEEKITGTETLQQNCSKQPTDQEPHNANSQGPATRKISQSLTGNRRETGLKRNPVNRAYTAADFKLFENAYFFLEWRRLGEVLGLPCDTAIAGYLLEHYKRNPTTTKRTCESCHIIFEVPGWCKNCSTKHLQSHGGCSDGSAGVAGVAACSDVAVDEDGAAGEDGSGDVKQQTTSSVSRNPRRKPADCPSEPQRTNPLAMQCSECGKTLGSLRQLKAHMREHQTWHQASDSTGQLVYTCNLCDKCFPSKNSIAAHSMIHREKTLACDNCGHKFSCRGNFARHVRSQMCKKPACDGDTTKQFTSDPVALDALRPREQNNCSLAALSGEKCGMWIVSEQQTVHHEFKVDPKEEDCRDGWEDFDPGAAELSLSSDLDFSTEKSRSEDSDKSRSKDFALRSQSTAALGSEDEGDLCASSEHAMDVDGDQSKSEVTKAPVIHMITEGKLQLGSQAVVSQFSVNRLLPNRSGKDRNKSGIKCSSEITGQTKCCSNTNGSHTSHFVCPDCGASFDQNCDFKNHMKSVDGRKEFLCTTCEAVFQRLSCLIQHKLVHHPPEVCTSPPMTRCSECGKILGSLRQLKVHMREHRTWHQARDSTGNLVYTCDVCEKSFSSQNSIAAHSMIHREKTSKCDRCGQEFSCRPNLVRHILSKICEKDLASSLGSDSGKCERRSWHQAIDNTGQVVYQCNMCEENFPSKNSIAAHSMMHREKTLACGKCGHKFSCRSNLARHVQSQICEKHSASKQDILAHSIKQSEKTLACNRCNQKFPSTARLAQHMQEHIRSRTCLHCGKVLKSLKTFLDHVNTHNRVKNYQCTDCDETFYGSTMYYLHRREKHPAHVCTYCFKTYHSMGKLRQHVKKVHKEDLKTASGSNLDSFKCHVCGVTYTEKATFLSHMVSHRNTQPFLCNVCGKRFKTKIGFRIHTNSHLGLNSKRFLCSLCGSRFYTITHLRYHMFSHSGERPFLCPECGTRFKNSSTLHSHRRRVHRITEDLRRGPGLSQHFVPVFGSATISASAASTEDSSVGTHCLNPVTAGERLQET